MAKAGFIMQGARGKLGDVVYKKGEGKTIMVERKDPRNPMTLRQAKQRCAFAMANSAAAGLRWLVNHSFQNINGEKQNIREFIRLNVKMLRAQIDRELNGGSMLQGNAQIKGARGMQAANYIVSRGSVYYPVFEGSSNGEAGVAIIPQGETALDTAITSQAGYEAVLATLGVTPGDQLSVVGIVNFPTVIATYDTESNYQCQSYGARVTFKSELPENFSGSLLLADGTINPALTETSETIGSIVISESTKSKEGTTYNVIDILIGNVPTGGTVQAVGVIRSQKDMNNKFTYSPCQLLFLSEGIDTATVVESYQTQTSDSSSDYFLDQAERKN